jgi:DNA (cytosine-5)-methyltransferase 1
VSPKNRPKKPIAVDLFCGAGGMTLGFKEAGFDVRVAIDIDPINVVVHKKNFPKTETLEADIFEATGASIRKDGKLGDEKVRVVFGGPPCQGFSLMGKRNLDDPRSKLIHEFVRIASELDADYFVLENVAGLLSGKTKAILDAAIEFAKSLGYNVEEPKILNAADFGVPQNRKRVFVFGYKKELPAPVYPEKIDSNPPTVWDAIGDLAAISKKGLYESDEYAGPLGKPSKYSKSLRTHSKQQTYRLTGCLRTRHTKDSVERFKKTEPGKQETISRFHRLSKEGQSNTLRAGTGKDKGSYMAARPIHPIQNRCITVREGARLHSFPDWVEFHSTRWHGFRQIGNAVPPSLAKAVAQSLISLQVH